MSAQEEAAERFQVEFVFEGREQISSFRIQQALGALRVELERQGVDQGAAHDAAYETERYYRRRGFAEASVSATWEESAPEKFVIRLQIEEGSRSLLEELSFEGNEALADAALSACFRWERSGLLGLGDAVFTEEVFDAGVECVLEKHRYEGFLFVEVERKVSAETPNRFRAHLKVIEAKRFFLAETPAITGAQAFSKERLAEDLGLELPTLYTPRLPIVLRGKLVDFYRKRGYLLAAVKTDRRIEPEEGEVFLSFTVNEGPLTTIEEIRIQGAEKTNEDVLQRRIRFRAGDLYNEELVRESTGSLFRSGLFNSVLLDATPVEGKPGKAHLDVRVKEKARYRMSLLGGWGSYELLRAGAEVENINLFGSGRRVRIAGSASFRAEGALAEYINPFFFSERLTHQVQVSYDRRENPSFERTEFGGETGLRYRFTPRVRGGLVYRLRQSQSDDVDQDVPPELIDDTLLSSVEVFTVADYRNSALDPTRGWTGRLGVEYSGDPIGSELNFLRPSALLTLVFSLWSPVQLLATARAAAIVPVADTEDIPIQERFFLGGESTVRSFEQDQAGPLQGGEPIGGEAFTNYSVELRFPIFRDLKGALFYDIGTLTERYENFGGGRHFQALGVGLRYKTPVGPLRADLAVNPERRGREDTLEFHFALGYPF